MKKSVILTIGIIYLIAIVVVGFIGISLKVYNQVVYVEEITCISEGYVVNEDNDDYDGYISKVYSEGLKVLLKCKINPENATEKKLSYSYDKNQSTYTLTVNEDGTASVNFITHGTAYITVKANDNHGTSIIIRIDAVDLGGII